MFGMMIGTLTWALGIFGLCSAVVVRIYLANTLPALSRYVSFALVVVGVAAIAFGQGYDHARATSREADLERKLATARADVENAHSRQRDEKEVTDVLNDLMQTHATELQSYKDALAKAGDRCVLSPDDARRLR